MPPFKFSRTVSNIYSPVATKPMTPEDLRAGTRW